MRAVLYLGLLLGQLSLVFTAYAGTNQKEQQLKHDMKSGQHEKSTANTFCQLLGNRVRQVNISTWVSGYLTGHAAGTGATVKTLKIEVVTAWLLDYCASHPGSSMRQAANALAKSKYPVSYSCKSNCR